MKEILLQASSHNYNGEWIIIILIIIAALLLFPRLFLPKNLPNDKIPILELILASLLLISFFLPWLSWGVIFTNITVRGYEIPSKIKDLLNITDIFPNNDNDSIIALYTSYLLYCIPTFSFAAIILGLNKKNNQSIHVARIASVIPILLGMIFLFLMVVGKKNDFLQYLDIGFYLSILIGIALWILTSTAYHSQKDVNIKNTGFLSSSDNSDLLNQLSQLHDLKQKKVITEEIYEQERKIILEKLQPEEQSNKIITQKEQQGSSIKPLTQSETIDEENQQLFSKGKWYQKPAFWIVTSAVVLISIGFWGWKTFNSNSLPTPYSNTTIYKLDTVINNVNINGGEYCIKALYEKRLSSNSSAQDEEDYKSITFLFFKDNIQKPELVKDILLEEGEVIYYNIYKGQNQTLDKEGRLYLLVNKSGGGSGSSSDVYTLSDKSGQVSINKIFEKNGELDYQIYHKNDDEILLLKGIWDFEENESHFANHRYLVKHYTFENGSFKETTVGKTKYKYSSLDEDKSIQQSLMDMKTKEPLLFQSINISDYKF